MPRSRQIKVKFPEDITAIDDDNPISDQVRFNLYRKEKEIKEISQILRELAQKKRSEQRQWLRENEDLMFDLAEDFVDESLYTLDGAEMDHETLEMSVQVMSQLRQTLGLFQTVLNNDDELEA